MRKTKICFITGGHWAAVMGGAQYQVKCILDAFVDSDEFEIYYLAREVNSEFVPQGYQIRQIAKSNRIRRHGFFFDANKLYSLLKEISPDIIYQRGLQSYTGIAAFYAKRHGARFIFHVAHDYDVSPDKVLGGQSPQKRLEKTIGQYGLRHASHIVTQTQHQSDLLKKHYNINAYRVIPNFHPFPNEVLDKPASTVKVAWVANFKPVKQPEVFVRLASDFVGNPEVEFIMIGRSGDRTKYGELLAQIDRLPNLNYLGERSLDEVNQELAGSHIFVNTSIAEGFANTFIQAWMRKLPVLSLNINTDGIFDSREKGIYCEDYQSLKEWLDKLVSNRPLLAQMGEASQAYAFERHSVNNSRAILELAMR